jgi:hypothetical protein
MKREVMIVLGLVLVAAAVLFWDQIMSAFAGMTPLEAMQTIVQYILHVTVITIFGFLIFGLPEIVKPWIEMLKRAPKRWRSGPNAQWQKAPRMPKLTAEQRTLLLLQQLQNGRTPRQTTPPSNMYEKDEQPLDLKF